MEFEVKLPKEKSTIWDNYVPILKSKDGRYKAIYITDAFTMPNEYNEACFELKSALPGDKIDIIINSPGGYAGSAFMLVDAIKHSKAHITAKISGDVASAATIITMACDDLEIAEHTQFMCHNYSHGTQGSGAQVKEYVNFADKEFTKAVKEIYAGFLSPAEMDSISKQDKEIWLNKEEVEKRWKARNEYLTLKKAADKEKAELVNKVFSDLMISELPTKKRGRPRKDS